MPLYTVGPEMDTCGTPNITNVLSVSTSKFASVEDRPTPCDETTMMIEVCRLRTIAIFKYIVVAFISNESGLHQTQLLLLPC